MAKKRKKKEQKKIEETTEENNLNVKSWIIKTLSMGGFLVFLVLITELMFDVELITDALIAIAIVVTIGFIHEGLHYREAVKLGYKVEWYRTKVTMGFDIISNDADTWEKDKKKIGYAPYKFIIPVILAITGIGVLLNHLGITVSGVALIVLHIYNFSREGRDIE